MIETLLSKIMRRLLSKIKKPNKIIKYHGKKMPIVDLATSISLAIQKQEGYGTAGAVTINANNNPGALRAWPGYPTVNGMAQFPDYQTGFDALVTNTTTNINKPNFTLADYITRYEGGAANVDKNNIPAYISSVSSQTGLPTDIPLSSLVDSAGVVAAATPIDTSGSSSQAGMIDLSGIDPTTLVITALVGIGLLMLITK
jgi:hypothetical protein